MDKDRRCRAVWAMTEILNLYIKLRTVTFKSQDDIIRIKNVIVYIQVTKHVVLIKIHIVK